MNIYGSKKEYLFLKTKLPQNEVHSLAIERNVCLENCIETRQLLFAHIYHEFCPDLLSLLAPNRKNSK